VSLGSKGAGLIFSAVVIFTAFFALYFGMTENPRPSDNRALAWFFSHFFYLSALIVTLQGEIALVFVLSYFVDAVHRYQLLPRF
jgi:hypothetical protein